MTFRVIYTSMKTTVCACITLYCNENDDYQKDLIKALFSGGMETAQRTYVHGWYCIIQLWSDSCKSKWNPEEYCWEYWRHTSCCELKWDCIMYVDGGFALFSHDVKRTLWRGESWLLILSRSQMVCGERSKCIYILHTKIDRAFTS